MLGEWGVTEEPSNQNYKPDFFPTPITELPTRYPRSRPLSTSTPAAVPLGQLDLDSSAASLKPSKIRGASLFSSRWLLTER